MRRAFFVLFICITLLLSSCITGSNVFSAESSGSMLLDALSASPARSRTEERPIEEVLAMPETEEEMGEEESPVTEAEPLDAETEETESLDEEPVAVVEEEPVIEPEVYEEPQPAELEAVPVPAEEEAAEPVAAVEEEKALPVEPAAAETEAIEEVPQLPEKTAAEPQVVYVEAEDELMHYSVDGWLLRLMIVSIVSVILFTAATAIRNGARRALPRVVSLILAVAFTAIPWLISIAIAGASIFWCIYLILLLTYVIFRSENRKRAVR